MEDTFDGIHVSPYASHSNERLYSVGIHIGPDGGNYSMKL